LAAAKTNGSRQQVDEREHTDAVADGYVVDNVNEVMSD